MFAVHVNRSCRTANVKYDWPYLTARQVRFTCNYDLYRDVTLLRGRATKDQRDGYLCPPLSLSLFFPRSSSLFLSFSLSPGGSMSLQSVHDMPAGVTQERNEGPRQIRFLAVKASSPSTRMLYTRTYNPLSLIPLLRPFSPFCPLASRTRGP